ncbi:MULTISPECIES: hypothetical protein [unclassified Bradyrhizobium]|uniref:hypothetical protein n=1 Tax=unclassified Bradyrhizobium TaxID=2631580 RepID=UPI001043D148|nr:MULTISPECIES: hypothetical protein [unclassified Bradyrhizobium]
MHDIAGQGSRPWTRWLREQARSCLQAKRAQVCIHRPLPAEHEQAECMRQIVRECRELLKQPPPDTFLGRRTMDAPAKEEADGDGRSVTSVGLNVLGVVTFAVGLCSSLRT